MPDASNNQLPNPHIDFAGRYNSGGNSFRSQAILWQFKDTNLEEPTATVSRYALRLIDRVTGRAYSADELITPEAVLAALEGEVIAPGAIVLSDLSNTAAPAGTLAWKGGVLAKHDGATIGGVPVSEVQVGTARIVGPTSIAGTARRNATGFLELGSVNVPASMVAAGHQFSITGSMVITSTSGQTIQDSALYFYLVERAQLVADPTLLSGLLIQILVPPENGLKDIKQFLLTAAFSTGAPGELSVEMSDGIYLDLKTSGAYIALGGLLTVDFFNSFPAIAASASNEFVFGLAWLNEGNTTVNTNLTIIPDLTISFT